jgi:hypothetical protein
MNHFSVYLWCYLSILFPFFSFAHAELQITRPVEDELVLTQHQVKGRVTPQTAKVVVFVRWMNPKIEDCWKACIPCAPTATDGSWNATCVFPEPSELNKRFEIVAFSFDERNDFRFGDCLLTQHLFAMKSQRSDVVRVAGVIYPRDTTCDIIRLVILYLRYIIPLIISVILILLSPDLGKILRIIVKVLKVPFGIKGG